MENDRLKELFQLTIETLIKGDPNKQTGICSILRNMLRTEVITFEERLAVLNYMKRNKPTLYNNYKEFTLSKYFVNFGFWWDEIHIAPETKQIRLDYLTKLMNNI